VSVCLLVTFVSPAETAEPTEIPFGWTDSYRSEESCVRWGQGRLDPFAASMGDYTTMRPFVGIFRSLVIVIITTQLTGIECASSEGR